MQYEDNSRYLLDPDQRRYISNILFFCHQICSDRPQYIIMF